MAAIDAVLVGRMALAHVGAGTSIESLTENSAEAKAINLWYDIARRQTLKAHNWNFARKRQLLAAHGDDPDLKVWAFRYKYPSDCLVARYMQNPLGKDADAVPFTVETSDDGTMSILSNLDLAKLVYTFDQQTTALFSEVFTAILARLIAHYIAYTLTGKKKISDTQLQIWQNMILLAPSQDANEGIDQPPREAEWVRGR